ncbi:MAG: hypothetical protein AAFZ80_08995 [Cyanobacteria bacterium P01_A01_bin.105]
MVRHQTSENGSLQAGEIVTSETGHRYRVLEVNEHSVSLMRVNGQTIFAYRPALAATLFSPMKPPQTS